MVDFSQIVALRDRKVQRVRKAETQALFAYEEASAFVEERQAEADAFLEKNRTLEFDLLQEILNSKITVRDVQAIEEKLRKAEEKARQYAARIAEAKEEQNNAAEAVQIARSDVRSARQQLRKSQEFQTQQDQEKRQRAIAAEEAALDEFSELMTARAWAK